MCIYNDTLFACGASKRKLEQRCPAEDCHQHIRWTYYSADNCADCGELPQQDATRSVFGTESIWSAAENACAGSGYLHTGKHPDHRVVSKEPSDFGDDEASSGTDDEWAWMSHEELLPDVELNDVDRAILPEIDRASGRSESSCERTGRKKRKSVTFADGDQGAAPVSGPRNSQHDSCADFMTCAAQLEEGMMSHPDECTRQRFEPRFDDF